MPDRPVLRELVVENLVTIERARLILDDGLNVLTGETGAGKTVLAGGLDLLLGGSASAKLVRPGTREAYVEGRWELPAGWLAAHAPHLDDVLDVHADEITLARRVTASGRGASLADGRTVTRDALRAVAGHLVAFYGQHEQRRLTVESSQADLLDRSGDGRGVELCAAHRAALETLTAARRAAVELAERADRMRREADLARYEASELADLAPRPGEASQIAGRLRRIDQAAGAAQAISGACAALRGDDAAAGAAHAARAASDLMRTVGDPELAQLADRAEQAAIELDDIAGDASALRDMFEVDGSDAGDLEQRLADLQRVARKHACDPDHLDELDAELQARVADLDDLPERAQQAALAEQRARERAERAAEKLRAWRDRAARKLAKQVTGDLPALAMPDATFAVTVTGPQDSVAAPRVEFGLAANAGMGMQPLAKVASGGELSRVMLALVSHCGAADASTLVLDEPDSGLGGNVAHGVADRLRGIADGQQVIVISHLPQIAARADRHFVIDKRSAGKTAATVIGALESRDDVVAELCRMGGHDPDQAAARQAADAMLRRAER